MGDNLSKCCRLSSTNVPTTLPVTETPLKNEELSQLQSKLNNMPKPKKITINDFEMIGELGQGGFGKVFLVRKKNCDEFQALKVIKKSLLQSGKDRRITVEEIFSEKDIMIKSDNPFLVKLISCFQDEGNLYFLMELLHGGNLFNYLAKSKRHYFSEEQARFYSAEVVLALEHLHDQMKIIYRDLKPENILLTKDGHIKLADFGLAKQAETMQGEVKGTPDFIAPEIYNNQEYSKMIDYWSLGCLIFELLYGKPAFTNDQKEKRYNKILTGKFSFPSEITTSEEAKSLIKDLLEVKVSKRLGYNGIEEIKSHPFFATVDWKAMYAKQISPPIHKLELKFQKLSSVKDITEPKGMNVEGFTYAPDTFQGNKLA